MVFGLDNRNRKVFGSPSYLHEMLTTLVGFVVQKLKRTSRMFSKISEALNTSLKNTFSRSSTKRVTKHTVWASDCIFCVKTVRSVSTVFSSLAT